MIIQSFNSGKRKGAALLTALVVLAVAAALSVTVAVHELSTRKAVEQATEQAQALWLARGGMEKARAHLTSDTSGNFKETLEIKGGKAVITAHNYGIKGWEVKVVAEFSRSEGRPAKVTLEKVFSVLKINGKSVVFPADQSLPKGVAPSK